MVSGGFVFQAVALPQRATAATTPALADGVWAERRLMPGRPAAARALSPCPAPLM
ncbi:hypothetical protein TRIHO_06380 [Tritonibacter horizontis]|uniref:Uncharacterized protein n=1 Tax=Tritonibacter horizontis TaxID=1768241 RepID=A0A132C1J9_9RHOB|nr:hypothetical protein TRIHO_06380 [Tritonibacter horizontis]